MKLISLISITTGYPPPTKEHIQWTFNDVLINHDDTRFHIWYGVMFTKLLIRRVGKEHVGRYGCRVGNFLGDYDQKEGSIINVKQAEGIPTGLRYIIGAGMFFLVLLVAAVTYGLRKLYRKNVFEPLKNDSLQQQQTCSVYISHCTQSEPDRKKLMKFVCLLEHNFQHLAAVLDLTRQVEINECGGFAQWVPNQMSEASKILVVLSQDYLDVVDNSSSELCVEQSGGQSAKVLMEYRFLETLLHENYHVCDKLILFVQGEVTGELPLVFNGRNVYTLPLRNKDFNKDIFTQLFRVKQHVDISV